MGRYIYSHFFLQPALGDADNIIHRENLFHIDKTLSSISMLLFLIVVWLLYRLFEPVNTHMAKWMTWPVIVCIPVGMSDALELTALDIFKQGLWLLIKGAR